MGRCVQSFVWLKKCRCVTASFGSCLVSPLSAHGDKNTGSPEVVSLAVDICS